MPTLYNRIHEFVPAWRAFRKDLNEKVSFRDPSEENQLFLSRRAPLSYAQALVMFDIARREAGNLWVRILEVDEQPHTTDSLRLLDEKLEAYLWLCTAAMHYVGRAERLRDGSTPEDEVQARKNILKFMFVQHMNLQWKINHERLSGA
jgi:hypothetical protein